MIVRLQTILNSQDILEPRPASIWLMIKY